MSTCRSRLTLTSPSRSSNTPGIVCDSHPGLAAGRRDDADDATGDRRHRDDHLVDMPRLDDIGELRQRPQHRHAVNPLADLDPVIIEKADRLHLEPWIPLHLADDHRARCAGAGDQHAFARLRGARRAGCDSPITRIDSRTAATAHRARIQSATKTDRENSKMNPKAKMPADTNTAIATEAAELAIISATTSSTVAYRQKRPYMPNA